MKEADSRRCRRLNLAGGRGTTMTRTGRNLRCETSGVDRLQNNGANCFVLIFSESMSVLLSLVKGIGKRGQVRIAP